MTWYRMFLGSHDSRTITSINFKCSLVGTSPDIKVYYLSVNTEPVSSEWLVMLFTNAFFYMQ